ncbi:hypothetical protein LPJ56_001215 [Coemansia sp. RSA 2599]|nr:hypothetical protein LPJ56_001215 [Coemansia sp. RSA 2599]
MDDSRKRTGRCFQRACFAEDEASIDLLGLRRSIAGTTAFWALVFLSVGVVYVLDKWINVIYVNVALRRADLAKAQYVWVQQNGKHLSLEKMNSVFVSPALVAHGFGPTAAGDEETVDSLASAEEERMLELPVFTFRHYRFVYHPQLDMFVSVGLWKDAQWAQGLATGTLGLTLQQHSQRLELFGKCIIDICEKSYLRLLVEEALNPFYVFQLASIAIWCAEEYYYYSIVIFAISLLSIAATLFSTKRTMRKIRQMSIYTCSVVVVRNGKRSVVDSSELVPGDIFELSETRFKTVPCEALLLDGDCIVNESMLTGESVPESKIAMTAASDYVLKDINMAAHTFPSDFSRHMLFAGTHLVRVRGRRGTNAACDSTDEKVIDAASYATAMVLRTGFNTTKGMLVRSILFPKPTSFKFYRDAFRFIGVLAIVALVGFIINTVNLHRLGVSTSRIVQRAFDLITVVIPPALPACMSIGVAFAASRLRKKSIFTISPSKINVASKVAAVCFDKTGTLTEDGLDLLGICVLSKQSEGSLAELAFCVEDLPENSHGFLSVVHALATCHSLSLVDGVPVGDPLESKMLEFSKWVISEGCYSPEAASGKENETMVKPVFTAHPPCASTVPGAMESADSAIGMSAARASRCEAVCALKVFEFSSNLRRSSVVTRALYSHDRICAYVKGAPEAIRAICQPQTIPTNYDSVLDGYTQSGRRVIALAGKQLFPDSYSSPGSIAGIERTAMESQLCFLGFLVFENKIKPGTTSVLEELRDARIRMIMCTGDNALTAVSIARECCLVADEARVFVSHLSSDSSGQKDSGLSSEKDSGIFRSNAPGLAMPRVCWKDALGSGGIELDPLTLEPFAANPLDQMAVQSAADLARSGRYCVAVTGDAFSYLFKECPEHSDVCKRILMRGAVYARMSPEQKADLIELLQGLGYITCFCGDGANDCAALKTADVGISLSEAEASVAAPFTSHVKNIGCVVELLKEGRCSIATSFGCFKFMALYSMIQFTSCCLLYVYNVNLSDGQYLFIDLFTILPIAVCMDRSKPYSRLVPKRPSASLTSKKVLASLIGNVALVIAFQVAVFFMVEAQPWYQKPRPEDPSDPDSVPNKCDLSTAIFLFSIFQYMFAGMVFNIGPPYRQPALRNYVYLAVVVLLVAFDMWMLLAPVKGFYSLFGLERTKVGWRLTLLGMAAANFVACYIGERFVFARIALPLAKLFRLAKWTVASIYYRARGVGLRSLYSPFKPAASIECGGDIYRSDDVREPAGLWSRLGYHQGRKEYKILLAKMAGGPSWY